MTERVLVFSLTPLASPHFQTELEVMLTHLEQGDEVHVARCEGTLDACEGNPYGLWVNCVLCRSRFRDGLDRTSVAPRHIHTLRPQDHASPTIPAFDSIEDLKRFVIDGVDIGEGVASSLITWIRDSDPPMGQWQPLIDRSITATHGLFHEAVRLLDQVRPDVAYIFNGRYATQRAAMRACEHRGTAFIIHERGYEVGYYRLMRGAMIQDLASSKRLMDEIWAASGPDREEVGSQYFIGRRYGGDGDTMKPYQFAAGMRGRSDQIERRPGTRLVAIMNSSEDEQASIAQFRNPIYHDQLEGLERIVRDQRLSDHDVVVRGHPNLTGLDNAQTRRLRALPPREGLRVVAPDETFNTYDLIEQADVVVTFGSTTGIESVYWGTPSVLAGRCAWEDLGAIRPSTHDEVIDAIRTRQPAPDQAQAIKYGYWIRRFRIPYRHYQQTSLEEGTLFDRPVRADPRFILGVTATNS